jgi:hypothetical protein
MMGQQAHLQGLMGRALTVLVALCSLLVLTGVARAGTLDVEVCGG